MNIATFRSFFHTTFPQHATATVNRVSPKQSLNNWEATKANSALAMFCFEASYNLDEQALSAFISKFSETPFLNCEGLILELSFQKNGDFAVYVYAAIEKIQAIEQALTQEAAELDQAQAEYEAAQAENEAEEVAPEFIGLKFPTLVHNAEADEFVTNLGTYPFLNGKISYKWGSYTYLCNSRGGVFCQGETIAEDVESAQDAYEIAREHFYNWERTQIQSAQQSGANDPQVVDVSADVTYTTLGINAKQALVLGETTAEQMQDNTPQEDAETREPFLELAHPDSLTDTEIADFFEELDLDPYGGFKIGSGGSMWKFVPANIEAEEQTVIFYFKNPYSFDCGVLVLAEYFQFKEAEYRAAYSAFYEHHQKIAGVTIHEETACTLGVPTGVEAAERQVDYILHHDIRCECLGLFGEYLDNARVVMYRCSLTGKPKYKAYQEVNGRLIYISNVNYLRPKTDLNLHRAMRAELDRQASLTKKSEQ